MASKKLIEHTVLDGVTGTQDGVWKDITSWRRTTIEINGISGDTVIISGSCATTKPANASHIVPIATITEDTIAEISSKLKWIKVRCSIFSAGTINAYLVGESTAYGI